MDSAHWKKDWGYVWDTLYITDHDWEKNLKRGEEKARRKEGSWGKLKRKRTKRHGFGDKEKEVDKKTEKRDKSSEITESWGKIKRKRTKRHGFGDKEKEVGQKRKNE